MTAAWKQLEIYVSKTKEIRHNVCCKFSSVADCLLIHPLSLCLGFKSHCYPQCYFMLINTSNKLKMHVCIHSHIHTHIHHTLWQVTLCNVTHLNILKVPYKYVHAHAYKSMYIQYSSCPQHYYYSQSLHWLTRTEQLDFRVQSLTYNIPQYDIPQYPTPSIITTTVWSILFTLHNHVFCNLSKQSAGPSLKIHLFQTSSTYLSHRFASKHHPL